jgi:molybdate transport system ATP-binding protein
VVESVVTAAGLRADLRLRRSDAFRLELALAIPPDTTAALLGPNGAGKTTVVDILAGLSAIDSGRIELTGAVLDDPDDGVMVPPEERRIGVVFQDYLLFPHLTVLDNVAFGLRSSRRDRADARDRAGEWLHRLGLAGLEDRKPRHLSGGQAQRVALARALVTEPDLLLLDEPLAALDVSTRAGLRRLLAEHLAAFPGPRLLITHDPAEAFLLADEIHVIEHGSITQSGTADDIRLRPRTPYVADLAGANLFVGDAKAGVVDVADLQLHLADAVDGPVLLTIKPTAISIHRHPPGGSPRNTWSTRVELIEHLGERMRLRTGAPLPVTVEITEAAAAELRLAEGDQVWLALKATEIGVEPDAA